MRILLLFVVALTALADDSFQILRSEAEGFSKVSPGKIFEFPADHAAHPDYQIEWWYLTANLQDSDGRHWGLQWTLFRQALSATPSKAGWSSNQLWMAHAAVSMPGGHQYEQRFARGGIGQTGVTLDDRFEAWIDDWVWLSENDSLFPSTLHFRIAGKGINMQLSSSADWVLHGDAGYSLKSQQGQASYYYSQPQIQISGTIEGTQLSGSAWLDREWSSQPLAKNQSGWDWFSLHLTDGSKLMLYRLRHDDGVHWLSGSWIKADGKLTHLPGEAIRLSEKNSRHIKTRESKKIFLPLDWVVSLPGLNRELHIRPLYDQQWMGGRFPYWEGVVLVEDANGTAAGTGYMELTGYQ